MTANEAGSHDNPEPRLRRIVIFQLILVLVTTAFAIFVGFAIAPLWKERQELKKDLVNAQNQLHESQTRLQVVNSELSTAQHSLSVSGEVNDLVSNALSSYHRKDYDGAVKYFDEALVIDPQNAYVLNLRGEAYFANNDYPRSIESMRAATVAYPQFAYAFYGLSRGYCGIKDFSQATLYLQQAITIDDVIRFRVASDYQFRKLCKPILSSFEIPRLTEKEQQGYGVSQLDRLHMATKP